MIIDMHSHYYGGLTESLKRRASRPYVSVDAQGRSILHAMTADTVMAEGYVDIDARLRYMDAAGIETQLLTFPGALGIDVMPVADVAEPIRRFNDHLARICEKSGGRFVGLAGLPLADMKRAAAEMRRAREELGLIGAILPGGFFSSIERANALRPVFEAANAHRALLTVHPGVAPDEQPPPPFPDTSVYRQSGLALQASIAQMGITLLFGGFPEAWPRIAFHLVNLGGTLPFIIERLEAIADSRNPETPFPTKSLRQLWYDCASLGPRAIEVATKVIGADRIMFGTDYPIFKPGQLRRTLDDADIAETDRASIASATARALIDTVQTGD